MTPHQILSLGAGVQSTTVLRMSIAGELPRLGHAIFADTGWEPEAIYRHVDRLAAECERAGIAFHRVSNGRNIREDAIVAQVRGTKVTGERWASMPLYTLSASGDKGMIRRQCTGEYKIEPIRRKVAELVGPKKTPGVVRQWLGISLDEYQRQRSSEVRYISHYYPLIERRMTRHGCVLWLESHGFDVPPKSACTGCPYHSDRTWAEMKADRPDEFEDACQVDDAIRRSGGIRGEVFLHRSCRPLREVGFAQLPSLFSDECAGVCGV